MPYARDDAAHLAAIVNSSDDAIISKDLNGIIQAWNIGAERIFGYTAEEAIGKSITILIPDDRLPEETEVISRIRAGKSVEHFETIRKHKDGRLIDISLTVSPVRASGGTIVGASKIARDITNQRRLRAIADNASRMKDEFLAVLSHELRTPLNTVLGYARMLRREEERMTAEQRQRALEALERNAEVLTRLVNDVLDTSRIITGKISLELKVCDVGRIVEMALDTMRPAAEAKDIAVETELETGVVVLGDGDRLQQVLWNIVSNAVKFTPSKGRIFVRARAVAGSVEIAVEDTGVGLTQEELPLVFQRFWQGQTGASREFGGLGIGLALARHILELHGGTIKVESEGTDRGSTFTVRLPAAAPQAVRAAANADGDDL